MENVYKGTLRAVPSGDNMVIQKKLKNGTYKTKTFFLSDIRCPKMGNNMRNEEPFAFDAREYLRNKFIGKTVTMREDFETADKNYGTLFAEEKNINLLLVELGLAKVNDVKKISEER
jgi:staphylococcal nuclease domain-containing protein 1